MELVLYGLSHPSRATRVAWALEEVGADWRHETVSTRTEAYAEIHPYQRVPALKVDGRILTESAACCLWVADAFPSASLAPTCGTLDRADHDHWVHFVISELEQPLWTKAKHRFALPEALRVEGLDATLKHEFERAAAVVDAHLGDGVHMFGDAFTVADLMVAHAGMWAMRAGYQLPGAFGRMAATHMARPALQRANRRAHG